MTDLTDLAIRILTDLDDPTPEDEARSILATVLRSDDDLTPEFLLAFAAALERGASGDKSGPQLVLVDNENPRRERH